jgi:uncharacterized membrane protein
MEQVAALFHPPLVHFAIVLPILIVLLVLVNFIVKRGATPEEPKGIGVSTLSFLLILAMVVIFAAAYVSGSQDGKAAWDTLSQAGQAELKEHKLIGTYLVYGSLVMLLFKFISFAGGKARILFLLVSIAFAAGTLKQGKDGGELVYTHGANVAALKTCNDKLTAKKPEAKAPTDSVAKEEAAAEANPKMTEGEPAAKAAVEETESKDAFEAKEADESLKKEAVADEAKTDAKAEVEAVTEMEAADAKKESAEFKKESEADTEKVVAPAEAH